MTLIFETIHFTIVAPDKPHIDRNEGGHIIISPKISVLDRQHLSLSLAHELMQLTIVVGKAMYAVMNARGVDIGRINYQDNGNWSVFKPEGAHLHIHLYGRAKSANIQKYGQACYFPHPKEKPEFYANLKPLTKEDVEAMRKEIETAWNKSSL